MQGFWGTVAKLRAAAQKHRKAARAQGYLGLDRGDIFRHMSASLIKTNNKLGAGCWGLVVESSPNWYKSIYPQTEIIQHLDRPIQNKETVYKLCTSIDGYLSWLRFVQSSSDLSPNARRFLPKIHNIAVVADGVSETLCASRNHSYEAYSAHILLVELERLEEVHSHKSWRKTNCIQHALEYLDYGRMPNSRRHSRTAAALQELYSHKEAPRMGDATEHNCMVRRSGNHKQLVITDPCSATTSISARPDIIHRLAV